ncbi:PhlD [Kitasatospora sp. NPDC088783]|uniref:PhlD n=1 Tax=Kitasatospora sp. NPDC088783 TaxID=3364077 RepID=UPI0037F5543E
MPPAAFATRPAVALPRYQVSLEAIIADTRRRNPNHPKWAFIERVMGNTGVKNRWFVEPFESTVDPDRKYHERNAVAWTHIQALAERAAREALSHAGLRPADISAVITSHSTGDVLPGLDVHLVNALELPEDVRRIPMTQLGCVGGAHAMIRALEQARLYPGQHVLVVLGEALSTIYDPHTQNIEGHIFNTLFGDSASAFVVSSTPLQASCLALEPQTWEAVLPHSTQRYRKDLSPSRAHFYSTKEATSAVPEIGAGLKRWLDKTPWPLEFAVAHSGGPAILNSFADVLDVPAHYLDRSWESLRTLGNIGGGSVIDVLRRTFDSPPAHGAQGVLVGVGPGFSGAALRCTWHNERT